MLLFTPGPTPVPERVRYAMAGPTIHHRTPEFTKIFLETRELLIELLKMEDALLFASTGTGGMEASVTNLCRRKALIVNSGKFGQRFVEIARAFGKEVVELRYPWDEAVKLDDVRKALKEHPDIDSFFIQICESSGGLRHPVEEVASLIKGMRGDEVVVVADGITAVGVEPIETDHLDALIAGSQKALMLPPGLAMVGLSEVAIERIGSGSGYYFNMAKELAKQRNGTTAYTAATTLIIGLREVLQILLREVGLDELFDQTDRRATATRLVVEALGLTLYPQKPAQAMTAIYDEDAEEIRSLLKAYGVHVAGGQDHLKGKLIRINHMGLIEPHEAAWVLNALELALDDMGRREYDGTANRLFCESYYRLLED
ncbi:MAG: aminotransferase [Nitratiruptor sp.]|nr:aminotransferase [Nitratiruptor sp.]NPA83845.1 alanine--glyoxylate aminotransferase family protein [Campylobacterota bacterium]